jgi:hypothetical protein
LGTISTSFNNLQGASAKALVGFNSPIPNYDTAISRVFLNGLTLTQETKFEVSVEGKKISEKQFEIEFVIGSQTSVTKIYLSYLIFSPSQSTFDSYGGVISKSSLEGSLNLNIHRIIGNLEYPFYGIVKLTSSASKVYLTSNIDKDLVFSLSSTAVIEQIDVSYIIVGTGPKKACEKCGPKALIQYED